MTFQKQEDITPKQLQLYNTIVDYVCMFGFQPNLTELGAKLKISRKAISDRLAQLTTKGYVELVGNRATKLLKTQFQCVIPTGKYGRLSPIEQRVIYTILNFVETYGYQPSCKEITSETGIASIQLEETFSSLIKRNYIRFTRYHHDRAINLLVVDVKVAPTEME